MLESLLFLFGFPAEFTPANPPLPAPIEGPIETPPVRDIMPVEPVSSVIDLGESHYYQAKFRDVIEREMPLSRIESQLQSIKSHIDAYTTTKEGEKFAVFQCNRDYFLRVPFEFTQAGLTVEDVCPGEHNHLTYLLLMDRDGKRITNTDQINHETIAILLDNKTEYDSDSIAESIRIFGDNREVGFFWNRLRAPTVYHGKCEVGRCAFINIKNTEVTDWDAQRMNDHPNGQKAKIAEMRYYFGDAIRTANFTLGRLTIDFTPHTPIHKLILAAPNTRICEQLNIDCNAPLGIRSMSPLPKHPKVTDLKQPLIVWGGPLACDSIANCLKWHGYEYEKFWNQIKGRLLAGIEQIKNRVKEGVDSGFSYVLCGGQWLVRIDEALLKKISAREICPDGLLPSETIFLFDTHGKRIRNTNAMKGEGTIYSISIDPHTHETHAGADSPFLFTRVIAGSCDGLKCRFNNAEQYPMVINKQNTYWPNDERVKQHHIKSIRERIPAFQDFYFEGDDLILQFSDGASLGNNILFYILQESL